MTGALKQLMVAIAVTVAPAANAATLTPIYSFNGGADGASPSGVIYQNGILYGTTSIGGVPNCFGRGCGTIFAINLTTNTETVLYAFTNRTDGYTPVGQLYYLNGLLYGTTQFGAGGGCYMNGCGTIFSVDSITGSETTLYAFTGGADGGYSWSGMIYQGGIFYGTTIFGGALKNGNVFSFNPTTNTESSIYSFAGGNDGSGPEGEVTYASGTLYGTTASGGPGNYGTVYAVNPSTGAETLLHTFTKKGASIPQAGLIAEGSTLYGVDFSGTKKARNGAVFSVNPANGKTATLYEFTGGSSGSLPDAPMVYQAGLLYGTTTAGGGSSACNGGCGTIFTVDPTKKKSGTIIYSFTGGSDGAGPGALIYQNGVFYGVTGSGGASGNGVVYMLTP